jgi:ferrous iron transport protein B
MQFGSLLTGGGFGLGTAAALLVFAGFWVLLLRPRFSEEKLGKRL